MDLSLTKEDQSSDGQNSDAHSKNEEELVDAATQALRTGSADQCVLGVHLISQLNAEVHQVLKYIKQEHFTRGHKTMSVRRFRNIRLFRIFKRSCTLLRTALRNAQTLTFSDESLHALMTQLLQLAQRCLTFCSEESCYVGSLDEMYIEVIVPTSWRPAFLDLSTVQLFFDLYASLPATLSPMALSCLVLLASVRQSIFSINEERVRFLSKLANGVRNVLQHSEGLSHSSNYHQFCRLVLRLTMNYEMEELVSVEHYPDVIQLIAQFTKESTHKWQSVLKSICCLLSFWHDMVYSPYCVQSTKPHLLEMYTHDIVKAYVSFYLESVSVVLRDGLEDPLDDAVAIQELLNKLVTIERSGHSKTCELLVQVFEQTAQRYQEVMTTHLNHELQQHSMEDIAVLEGQLTWLVYIITSVIGQQSCFFDGHDTEDKHDIHVMHGDLACRVLQLMSFTDSCLPERGCEKWELAIIALFYSLEDANGDRYNDDVSEFYECLSQTLGLADGSKIWAVLIKKIIMNFKHWSHSDQVLSSTLKFMLHFTSFSAKELAGLDDVQVMMNNPTSEQFPFLAPGMPVQVMRHRTSFYTCLGYLLITDLGEDEEKFTRFMIPITTALDNVKQLLAQAETPVFRAEEAKKKLIGLARDLRGLAYALDTAVPFMMLFYWIYPTCTAVMIQGIEIWRHDPEVTTPVLKLFAELMKENYALTPRLQFHASSANGILLHQEANKIVSTYGSGIRTKDDKIPKDQFYPMRLKGINTCCYILNVLHHKREELGQFGSHVPAIHTFANLLPSMPLIDLQMYEKLSDDYFCFLQWMLSDHMNIFITLEPNVLLFVISSLSEGVSNIEDSSLPVNCLDYLLTYLYEQLHHENETDTVNLENDNLVKLVQEQPSILQQLLATVLKLCTTEEDWLYYMSNILLPLILLNKEYFGQLRQPTISRCAAHKQAGVAKWLDGLMEGIEPNLLSANREKFQENALHTR